jgi:hypothetical protein
MARLRVYEIGIFEEAEDYGEALRKAEKRLTSVNKKTTTTITEIGNCGVFIEESIDPDTYEKLQYIKNTL